MSDPAFIPHVRGRRTVFGLRLRRDGDVIDLSGLTLKAGMEKDDSTAAGFFATFGVTGHGAAGTLSGTIPSTGISFTGASTMRIYYGTGGAQTYLGPPVPVRVRALSANWMNAS